VALTRRGCRTSKLTFRTSWLCRRDVLTSVIVAGSCTAYSLLIFAPVDRLWGPHARLEVGRDAQGAPFTVRFHPIAMRGLAAPARRRVRSRCFRFFGLKRFTKRLQEISSRKDAKQCPEQSRRARQVRINEKNIFSLGSWRLGGGHPFSGSVGCYLTVNFEHAGWCLCWSYVVVRRDCRVLRRS
jgi:hypothetical protein